MNWNWKFRAVWILCLGVNDMSREMKDSGVEWIGEIPKNWNVQRVKNAFVRKKAEAHQENPVVLSLARAGVKVRDLSKNEGQIAESYYNYNLVEFGDLLLNPMDLYSGANCSISMVEGVISPAYINLRAKSGYSSRFYDYYFKTQYWSMAMFAHGKGVSFENRWTLGIEELFNYKIPVPLENEQDKIADFLDGQCEKINLAIEKAKVSIEEYRNLKQSFITQIVTKGINENDTMKESGIEWIGKIPASWKVTQLRHCASIRSGITLGKTYSKDTELVEMPYLRVANVQDGYVDTNDIAVLQVSKDEIEKYSLSAGEVLMTEGGDRDKLGRGCVWDGRITPCLHQNHIFAVKVKEKLLNPHYLEYLTASSVGRTYFDVTAVKTTNLACTSSSKVLAFTIPGVYISCKRIYPETKYLKFALGFHPQDVSLKDADFYDFMQLVNTTNYVGEIGLDFSRQSYISRNKQCMYFEQIVRVCAEKDKLMSVHLRRAEEEAISILKKYRPRRCIIHWFNGNGEQLQQLVDIGCYFSLNSNMVTNEKNKEKLYLIPKTRVLIESDGPFTKIDGKKYTFNNLIKIYELVARYYNEPDIIKMVYANFRDILSK